MEESGASLVVRRNHPRRRGENTDNPPLSSSQIAFSRVFSASRPAFPWEKRVCSHSRYTGGRGIPRGGRGNQCIPAPAFCACYSSDSHPKPAWPRHALCVFCCLVRAPQRLSFLLFSFLSLSLFLSLSFRAVADLFSLHSAPFTTSVLLVSQGLTKR